MKVRQRESRGGLELMWSGMGGYRADNKGDD